MVLLLSITTALRRDISSSRAFLRPSSSAALIVHILAGPKPLKILWSPSLFIMEWASSNKLLWQRVKILRAMSTALMPFCPVLIRIANSSTSERESAPLAIIFSRGDRLLPNRVSSLNMLIYLARSTYSPVLVLTTIFSPWLMKRGTRTVAPVSTVAGFIALVAVLPMRPGSQ